MILDMFSLEKTGVGKGGKRRKITLTYLDVIMLTLMGKGATLLVRCSRSILIRNVMGGSLWNVVLLCLINVLYAALLAMLSRSKFMCRVS